MSSNGTVEVFTLDNGITVETYQDTNDFETPRDWDNLGTMLCKHPDYALGDRKGKNTVEYKAITKRDYIFLPLYLYDHSGLAMHTRKEGSFSCPWDTSHVGKIYVSKDKVREEYNVKRITKKIREKVLEVLEGEVKEYSLYLEGEIYGFNATNKDGKLIDSCGGYFMEYDDFKDMIIAELGGKEQSAT